VRLTKSEKSYERFTVHVIFHQCFLHHYVLSYLWFYFPLTTTTVQRRLRTNRLTLFASRGASADTLLLWLEGNALSLTCELSHVFLIGRANWAKFICTHS